VKYARSSDFEKACMRTASLSLGIFNVTDRVCFGPLVLRPVLEKRRQCEPSWRNVR
jgi:hypothetical protein